MMILYDVVGTLAESVGKAIAEPKYVEIIMPPLIQRYSMVADDDRDIFNLLEVSLCYYMGVWREFVV